VIRGSTDAREDQRFGNGGDRPAQLFPHLEAGFIEKSLSPPQLQTVQQWHVI
jgi:hypothetical protein